MAHAIYRSQVIFAIEYDPESYTGFHTSNDERVGFGLIVQRAKKNYLVREHFEAYLNFQFWHSI
jgi:hypothetical protein